MTGAAGNLANQILVGTNLVTLTNNEASVVTDPANAAGGQQFAGAGRRHDLPPGSHDAGRQFSLTFMYRGPALTAVAAAMGNDDGQFGSRKIMGINGELIGGQLPAGEVGRPLNLRMRVGNSSLRAPTPM